ncbi:glutathione S-transferase N-terminal domain-containing protein [Myxococcota bacterium]|nr:glutathione S-transferase N-terminal domain-containing protein [Myxococcota bacterium]
MSTEISIEVAPAKTKEAEKVKKQPKVILFSTPTCSWCRKIEAYFRQNNIKYKKIDVSRDERAAKDMMKKSGQAGVPQTWINNRPVVGFDKNQINRLLGIG